MSVVALGGRSETSVVWLLSGGKRTDVVQSPFRPDRCRRLQCRTELWAEALQWPARRQSIAQHAVVWNADSVNRKREGPMAVEIKSTVEDFCVDRGRGE